MQLSKEEKGMWLEDWRVSGKSAWAYAKENGLVPQTFSRWVKLETERKQGFVEIPVHQVPFLQTADRILIEKGELKIHIPIGKGSSQFRSFMEGLGALL
jgi:hypothetical protein